MVYCDFAVEFGGGAGVEQFGRGRAGGVGQGGADGCVEAGGEGFCGGGNRAVKHFTALFFPGFVAQVHNVDIVAAEVFQDPGGHGGVAAILMVVEYGGNVVAQSGGGEGGGQLLRGGEASVGGLQFFEGDADGAAQVSHQVAHCGAGVDEQAVGPVDARGDPVGGDEGGHRVSPPFRSRFQRWWSWRPTG